MGEFRWFANPPPGRMADPPTAGIIQGPMGIFLHSRPKIHGVRNYALSAQLSGDFDDFLRADRNFTEERPYAAEPAGRRTREQRRFIGIF